MDNQLLKIIENGRKRKKQNWVYVFLVPRTIIWAVKWTKPITNYFYSLLKLKLGLHLTTLPNNEKQKEDIIYTAFAEAFFNTAFFGMIKKIDSSLMQILGFCLAFITAEAVITAFVNISGQLTTLSIFLFLTAYIAFLISAIILILAISERAPLDITWSLDINTIIDDCKSSLLTAYKSKHRKQSAAIVILFIGVGFLLTSIIYAVTIVNF